MGLRFRKSFKIAPGVKLNLNKKSAGITFGGKGAHFTMNTKGKNTTSVGVPGTGLYYTSTSGGGSTGSGSSGGGGNNGGGGNHYGNNYNAPQGPMYQPPKKDYTVATIVLLILFFPVGLILMWTKTDWNKKVKIAISAVFAVLTLIGFIGAGNQSDLPASSAGIQRIEIEESEVRMDLEDVYNMTSSIQVDYSQDHSSEILEGDFVFVFADEGIASAEVQYLFDGYFSAELRAEGPGTTTMHIETIDGVIKSNKITVEVIGERATLVDTEDETETTETTTRETTTEEATTEEETTKDTSRTVYITLTGEKYHYSKSCAGDNAIETNLDEVKDTHEPCKKCAQ